MIWWWFFILCTMWWIICMTLSTGPPTCPPSTPASPSPSLLPFSSFSRWAEHPTSSSLLLWLPSSSTFQRCSRRQAADRREQTRCHSRTNYDLNCEETRQLDQLWKKPDNRVMWRSWSPPADQLWSLMPNELSCQVDKELKGQLAFMSQLWSNAVLGISA